MDYCIFSGCGKMRTVVLGVCLDRVSQSCQQDCLSDLCFGFVVALENLALRTGGVHRGESVFVVYVFV